MINIEARPKLSLLFFFDHYYYDYVYVFNPIDDDGESQTTKDPESSDSTSATTKPTNAPPIVGKYYCKIDQYYCLQIKFLDNTQIDRNSLHLYHFSVWIE